MDSDQLDYLKNISLACRICLDEENIKNDFDNPFVNMC